MRAPAAAEIGMYSLERQADITLPRGWNREGFVSGKGQGKASGKHFFLHTTETPSILMENYLRRPGGEAVV
jgi:hypothetical protein